MPVPWFTSSFLSQRCSTVSNAGSWYKYTFLSRSCSRLDTISALSHSREKTRSDSDTAFCTLRQHFPHYHTTRLDLLNNTRLKLFMLNLYPIIMKYVLTKTQNCCLMFNIQQVMRWQNFVAFLLVFNIFQAILTRRFCPEYYQWFLILAVLYEDDHSSVASVMIPSFRLHVVLKVFSVVTKPFGLVVRVLENLQ